ncbi:MAG TPA: aminotransferase class I/II-fold pyridoxal phosphate-dependent enzyme [Fimbriimonadaceae bacterium]|nr:aminotransferase class I/II-fold pyridoxal phosphate-dependent enzyme [Fimbriimonadaceae bacterium]
MRFATKAMVVGQAPHGDFGAAIHPIYQSATFVWKDLDTLPKYDYTRCGGPNIGALEQVLGSLENASHCLVFGSGMAAITAAFSVLEAGDHLLVASDIYGGTHRLAYAQLPKQGVEVSEFDASRPCTLSEAVRPNTKVAIFESPTNPNLRIIDIAAVVAEAKKSNLITVFDNTFASPALQNPLDLGVDVVVHSTTKYVSGHSDIIGGAIVLNDDDLYARYKEFSKTVGAVASPFDAWLSLRGLKTLDVRMQRHCENALKIATFLADHPRVAKVHYPGLVDHPDYQLARRQMRGFGGMLAVDIDGTVAQARRVAESTKIFLLAESLGGVESLIAYPPLMSHATMTEEQRLAKGIPPTLLRVSVGIEDAQDLIEDLDQALAKA